MGEGEEGCLEGDGGVVAGVSWGGVVVCWFVGWSCGLRHDVGLWEGL